MSYRLKQHIVNESYDNYLKNKNNKKPNKDKWIKDVVLGTLTIDDMIYSDDLFVMFPPAKWNGSDINKFHMLAFVKDLNIMSLRDLNSSHLDLLNHILSKGCEIINEKFGIKQNELRIYVHYPPTTWLLHIHFNNIVDTSSSTSVEYSHSLYSIIQNLQLKSDYYKQDLFVLK